MTTLRRLLMIVLSLALAWLLSPTSSWAASATLTMPDVCPGTIAVIAFDYQAGVAAPGGRPSFGPLGVIKNLDSCSPLLLRFAFSGRRINIATIEVFDDTGSSSFTIQTSDVVITSVNNSNTTGPGVALAESISLVFLRLTLISPGDPPVQVTCDIRTLTCL